MDSATAHVLSAVSRGLSGQVIIAYRAAPALCTRGCFIYLIEDLGDTCWLICDLA